MTDHPKPHVNPWHMAESRDEGVMWLAWMIRLRWIAILAQVSTLSFTFTVLDEPELVIPGLLAVTLVLVAANLASLRMLRTQDHISQTTLLLELSLDVGVLTAVFAVTGGTDNPFVMLYVVHVAMASVMLRNAYAIGLTVAAVVINLILHVAKLPLHPDQHIIPGETLMRFGQSVAFTVTAASVGTFVMGMSATLRRQKQRLLEHRERSARTDRLRAVGTLAAGAAHELNTPLSTLSLRVRRIARRYDDPETARDLEVIRTQLDRCKQIVDQLLVGAGDPSADGIRRVDLGDLVVNTVKMWSKSTEHGALVHAEAKVTIEIPPVAFAQALINLLENAREAQEEAGTSAALDVYVRREGAEGREGVVLIHDRGVGLPEQPDRIGEPFFTTKPTGTGLGVFVARSVAEGAGGGLRYERVSETTITRWWFPECAAQDRRGRGPDGSEAPEA